MTNISNNILAGKKGIIFGVMDEKSLAWAVAQHCVNEGAAIVITNTKNATMLGPVKELSNTINTPFIECDATQESDLESLLTKSQEILGGKIDFILHAVAQSTNLRRHKTYEEANYAYFHETLDISALSLHKLLHTALRLDALQKNASILTLTYIASERSMYGYNDMSDAKALLESIVRNFGRILGEKNRIRVNAVSQSPTPTKAGSHWKEESYFYKYSNKLAPLGNASADDLAKLCVMLFSDYSQFVTMQTIYNDGGFSKTLLSPDLVETFRYAFDQEQ
ncbi:MAG: SDR family oxidoreductase [Bacteroidales bacterium]|nr:SDR family oxidoreductase [Bacteroidales bacterium]